MAVSPPGSHRPAGWILTVAGALMVGYYTLRPGEAGPPPATDFGYLLTDIVLNVLLFLPLGAGFALLGMRLPGVCLLLGITSGTIELTQLLWLSGRFASVHDVVMNTAGGGLGALLVHRWSAFGRWRRAGFALFCCTLPAAWTAGAFLIRPSAPPGAPWFGQWAHDFKGVETFSGRVLEVTLQGLPVPDGPLAETAALRAGMDRGDTIRFAIRIVSGPAVAGRAQLAAVVDGRGGELVSLWQKGTSLVARQRLGLSNAGMRNPWLRLHGALPDAPGDSITIVLTATQRSLELVSSYRKVAASHQPLSSDLFWTGFLPFEYHIESGFHGWPALGAFLMFALLGILGRGRAIWIAACALVSLLPGPVLADSAIAPWYIWIAIALGAGLGLRVSRTLPA